LIEFKIVNGRDRTPIPVEGQDPATHIGEKRRKVLKFPDEEIRSTVQRQFPEIVSRHVPPDAGGLLRQAFVRRTKPLTSRCDGCLLGI
jgi:hypothetical protein